MATKTVGDLVTTVQSDQDVLAGDALAITKLTSDLQAAQSKQTGDQAELATDMKALGSAVAAVKGFYVDNLNGSVTAYEPDNQGGFTTKTLLPATTPVPS